MALAAIGTVICRKEVASEPPRLPRLCFEAGGAASPAGSLHTEVTSSSLKLTRRVFFPLLFILLVGLGFEPEIPAVVAKETTGGSVACCCLTDTAVASADIASADAPAGWSADDTAPSVGFSSKLLKLAEGEILGVGWMTFMSMD